MTTPNTDLAPASAAELEAIQAIQDQQEAEFEGDTFQTPILKLAQPLTREVQEEEAEAGEFIDTLTGESLGTKVEFIVAFYHKGRAARDNDSGRYFVGPHDTIPAHWADLVGEEFVGTPFSEYPDAEEQYKARVNRGEIEWGKGPLISTTYNYVGLVYPPQAEDEDEAPEARPVKLALTRRSNRQAIDKIGSLKRMTLRNRPFWDKVFEFTTSRKVFGNNAAYVVNVKLTRDTEPEERTLASELAQAVVGGRVQSNEDKAEAGSAPVEPESKGGLEV